MSQKNIAKSVLQKHFPRVTDYIYWAYGLNRQLVLSPFTRVVFWLTRKDNGKIIKHLQFEHPEELNYKCKNGYLAIEIDSLKYRIFKLYPDTEIEFCENYDTHCAVYYLDSKKFSYNSYYSLCDKDNILIKAGVNFNHNKINRFVEDFFIDNLFARHYVSYSLVKGYNLRLEDFRLMVFCLIAGNNGENITKNVKAVWFKSGIYIVDSLFKFSDDKNYIILRPSTLLGGEYNSITLCVDAEGKKYKYVGLEIVEYLCLSDRKVDCIRLKDRLPEIKSIDDLL